MDHYKINTTTVEPSFLSCSSVRGVAQGFMGWGSPNFVATLFVIASSSARSIQHLSMFQGESELLLAPGYNSEFLM